MEMSRVYQTMSANSDYGNGTMHIVNISSTYENRIRVTNMLPDSPI